MEGKDIGILAAQIACSAAAIAAAIFIPPPIGQIVALGIEIVSDAAIAMAEAATGDQIGALTSVLFGAISYIPGSSVAAAAGKVAAKTSGKAATKTINKVALNLEKYTAKLSAKIDNMAPDKVIDRALAKWNKQSDKTTLFQDNQLIMKKQMELETEGQVRTEKKISSTTFNKDSSSWIKCAHFEEERFIDKNNIIGTLTIFYYVNNGSRLGLRKRKELNGNSAVVAIPIPNCRYKNDYVSGICRAGSWGAYYMRTWMTGKPGRGHEGINTAFWFGSEWRVDKKLSMLLNKYQHLDGVLKNYSAKTAEKFIGKTKIGTKLLSFKDVYTKANTAKNQVLSGKADFIKPYLKKMKKG